MATGKDISRVRCKASQRNPSTCDLHLRVAKPVSSQLVNPATTRPRGLGNTVSTPLVVSRTTSGLPRSTPYTPSECISLEPRSTKSEAPNNPASIVAVDRLLIIGAYIWSRSLIGHCPPYLCPTAGRPGRRRTRGSRAPGSPRRRSGTSCARSRRTGSCATGSRSNIYVATRACRSAGS